MILETQFIGMHHIFNWMNCIEGANGRNGAGGSIGINTIALRRLKVLAVTQRVCLHNLSRLSQKERERRMVDIMCELDPKFLSHCTPLLPSATDWWYQTTFEYRSTQSKGMHMVLLVWWTYEIVGVVTEWEPTGGNLQ